MANKYEFQLANGKTLTLEGDTQPTDEEVESIAKEQGVQLQEAEPKVDLTIPENLRVPTETAQTETKPESRSLYQHFFEAPQFVTDAAHKLQEAITEPSTFSPTGEGGLHDYLAGTYARAKGFAGGAAEGAASLLSPANIISLGKGKLPQLATRLLGGGQIAHGFKNIYEGDVWEGIGDIGFGILGALGPSLHEPTSTQSIETPSGRTTVTGPENVIKQHYGPVEQVNIPEGQPIDRVSQVRESIANRVVEPEIVPPQSPFETQPTKSLNPEAVPERKGLPFAVDNQRKVFLEHGMTPEEISKLGPEESDALFESLRQIESPQSLEGGVELDINNPQHAEVLTKTLEDSIAATKSPDEIINPEQPLNWKTDKIRQTRSNAISEESPFDISRTDNPGTVVIEAGKSSPTKVNELRQKGYQYAGQQPDGSFKFVLSPKAVTPESAKNIEPIIRKMKDMPEEQAGILRELWNAPQTLMSVDLPFITSAGLRQALPMIGTPSWIKAWGPSIRAYGSRKFYDAHSALLKADPLMQRRTAPVFDAFGKPKLEQGRPVLKEIPSIAEEAGVSFADLGSLSKREEVIKSSLAERMPIWGKVVAASNRSYVAFLNDLRLSAFRNMYDAMPDKTDKIALKALGDAINTFTGKGPLRTKIPESVNILGKEREVPNILQGKGIDIERYGGALGELLFAPRLIASRMQMLNPINYTMAPPQVRKEYLAAAARTAGAWLTLASLGKMAGGEVNLDPRSADFGKIRIGKLRLDPAGGFQQFLVMLSRQATGEFTSTTSNRTFELGKGFGAKSKFETFQDFAANKLKPQVKYFFDAWNAKERRTFPMADRALQLAIPLMTNDMIQLAKEHPELVPLVAPLVSAGIGQQYYGKEKLGQSVYVPEKYDIVLGR